MQAGKQIVNRFEYATPGTAVSDMPNSTAVRKKDAMTFKLDFDEACNLITVVAIGSANKDSRLESLRAVRMDPRFPDDYPIFCKFSYTVHLPPSPHCLSLAPTPSP